MKKYILILLALLLFLPLAGQRVGSAVVYSSTSAVEEELYGVEELWDGYTAIWLEHDTLLAESSGAVSSWIDIANGYTLLPYASDGTAGTSDNYPSWTAENGVVFDGVNDVLKYMVSGWTTFGTIYAVVRQVSWTDNDVLFSYAGTGGTRIAEDNTAEGGAPNIHLIHSSGSSLAITGLAVGSWGLLTVDVDGSHQLVVCSLEMVPRLQTPIQWPDLHRQV